MTKTFAEAFGPGLVRVLKKVKRKTGDAHQAFYVKQAAPGDRYAAVKGAQPVSSKSAQDEEQPVQAQEAPVDAAQPEQQAKPDLSAPAEQQVPSQVTRLMVRYHEIPWKPMATKKKQEVDPIPPAIRRRFEKNSKTSSFKGPEIAEIPVVTVIPTDRLAWGTDEPGLLVTLRTGQIKKMRLAGGGHGLMVAKIHATSGGVYYAYMWLESLRSPLIRQLWGKTIVLEGRGALARRATCAYEIAKTCGMDDLVPPTVYRVDNDGDIKSMLPNDLIESSLKNEWIVGVTGKDANSVRDNLSGDATIQMIRGDLRPIEAEGWFRNLFGTSDDESISRIWSSSMPVEVRASLLRVAVFDFIIGNLDRSWGDIAFSDDQDHPIIAFGNEVSLPCPRAIGLAYASGGYAGYLDESGGVPLAWNELASMISVNGDRRETLDFEESGLVVCQRMKEDRPVELVRTLLDHRLTPLQIAGVLSRIWMLTSFGENIARDPYFAAEYYASVIAGKVEQGLESIEEFVNGAMRKGLARGFDFSKEMKSKDNDEADS